MGWFSRWMGDGDTEWPHDPYLDAFRDAVWRLSLDGDTKGWVTTSVTPMRSLPFFWIRKESMWSQVHWVDGKREFVEEDYYPWFTVEELLTGRFVTFDSDGRGEGTFDVESVTGPERDRLWAHLSHGVEPGALG